MNLSPHFTLQEFTDSDTAVRLRIDNSLPAGLLVAAQDTCNMLERIREHLSAAAGKPVPIIITSGYRCLALNRAIRSDDDSHHVVAAAADIKVPAFGTAYSVALALKDHVEQLGIGQLIHEFGQWVHVSTRQVRAVNRVITISKAGKFVGIREV